MADSEEKPDEKLGMSLDELIKMREQRQYGSGERLQHGRSQGRGQTQGRGFQNRGPYQNGRGRPNNNPGFTNTGLLMPNFGLPYGSFPPGPAFMDPRAFGGLPFGFPQHGMQADRMMAMPGDMLPLPGGPAGAFFSSGFPVRPMPPQSDAYAPAEPAKPATPAAVPQAKLDEETGEVTVAFKGKLIVKVSRAGTITLDTGGVRGPAVFMALNAVLNVVGISITRPKKDDEWSISDGRSLMRFRDGVTLPGKGPQSVQRGPKIVAAFGGADPSAAAAATAASNAAAAAAGIVLPGKGAAGKGNSDGKERGGRSQPKKRAGDNEDKEQQTAVTNGAAANDTSPLGGSGSEAADRVRRLRAKGRYKPY